MSERRLVRVVLFAYPALLVASFYLVWVTAWVSLGHRPRYMLDDPKYISWVVDVPSALAALMTFFAPNVLLAAIALFSLARFVGEGSRGERLRGWLRDVAQLALCWVAALTVLRVDPLGVVSWWLD